MNARDDRTLYQIVKANIITLVVLAGSIFISYNTLAVANKLAPLHEDISVIKQALASVDKDLEDHKITSGKLADERNEQVLKRLDRMEQKLDTVVYYEKGGE